MVRRGTLWLASLSMLGLVWGSVACASGSSGGHSAGSAKATPTPSLANTASSDGGVTMSIAGVDCTRKSATGNLCYVTYRAVNISDGFPVFTEADQVAYGASGRQFHADPAADAVANHGKPVTQRLPRGVPVTGVLVFDIPAGDRLERVVLHGKPGTPGEVFSVS